MTKRSLDRSPSKLYWSEKRQIEKRIKIMEQPTRRGRVIGEGRKVCKEGGEGLQRGLGDKANSDPWGGRGKGERERDRILYLRKRRKPIEQLLIRRETTQLRK